MSTTKRKIDKNSDLKDNKHDRERLEKEETTIDIPDVKDIPGQEHVHVPRFKEMADTTISSDDEEGKNVWKDEDESSGDSSVSKQERDLLEDAADARMTRDEDSLQRSALDSTDNEGEPLNEDSFGEDLSGSDLDIPGAEDDDENEAKGEEDEENNSYSLGGDDNSENEERTGN